MNTFIGLLRGINVGGRNKLKMAELKNALATAGLKDVVTYIQSGNLVFQSGKKIPAIELLISKTIRSEFGYEVPVMVRDKKYFDKLFAACPFEGRDIKFCHLTLLSEPPDKKKVKEISEVDIGQDEFVVKKDLIYVWAPSGYSKTKLTNGFYEKKLGVRATTRNWKTVAKLVALAQGN